MAELAAGQARATARGAPDLIGEDDRDIVASFSGLAVRTLGSLLVRLIPDAKMPVR